MTQPVAPMGNNRIGMKYCNIDMFLSVPVLTISSDAIELSEKWGSKLTKHIENLAYDVARQRDYKCNIDDVRGNIRQALCDLINEFDQLQIIGEL